ncbi:MAG: hypothetical protein KIT62_00855 [Cyclobacteriaceae bacterium]|nr:hypothetical protein [Cyclobacteriaceae bacterium]
MKFLSLFTKAPQHQRFNYIPRFYDPQKEEMQERENRIKKEIEREQGIVSETPGDYRSRIAGSFQAARKRSKPAIGANAVMIRLGVLLFLSVFIIAFLEWGRPVLYSLFLFIPVYFYLKFKSK